MLEDEKSINLSFIDKIISSLRLLNLISEKTTRKYSTLSGQVQVIDVYSSVGGKGFTLYDKKSTGIAFTVNPKMKILEFTKINSSNLGVGSQMVDAVIKNVPSDWSFAVDRDWSNGFWSKMKNKYSSRNWV